MEAIRRQIEHTSNRGNNFDKAKHKYRKVKSTSLRKQNNMHVPTRDMKTSWDGRNQAKYEAPSGSVQLVLRPMTKLHRT